MRRLTVGSPASAAKNAGNQFYNTMPLLCFAIILLCITEVFSQSGCPVYSFRCSTGQCIKGTAVCDGAVDCRDGSDETHATCSRLSVECPSFAFRCAYGACVDKNKTCDFVQDCADNSDELLPECQQNEKEGKITNVVCKKREFTCNSGHCIHDTAVCDGSSDCYDGSDETITQCINVRCPGYSFQCAYGGCIDKYKSCNGVEDCKDGSDEEPEICEPKKPTKPPFPISTTPKPTPVNGCLLPEKPNGGSYEVITCDADDKSEKCREVPETEVEYFTIIKFSCFAGFALPQQDETSFCGRNGKWVPELVECKKLCPSLKSDTVDLTCTRYGQATNCTGNIHPGTIVKYECKPAFQRKEIESYDLNNLAETECLPSGTWSNPLYSCKPGKPQSPVVVHIYNIFILNSGLHKQLSSLSGINKLSSDNALSNINDLLATNEL